MEFRGMNYDVGTQFGQVATGAFRLSDATLLRDFRAIRDDLNCNSIQIYGSDPARLARSASLAHRLGLRIWLQPRLIDHSASSHLDQLREVAIVGEELRKSGCDLAINVGCELSIFMPGLIAGGTFQERIRRLAEFQGDFSSIRAGLDAHLGECLEVARPVFSGPLTYAAGFWESPNWQGFDFIGLNQYMMALNRDGYAKTLRSHVGSGKPVLVTEFGCCAYAGAAELGPAGYNIIDWSAHPARIREDVTRDEAEQARYVGQLLDIFFREQVRGAFIYTFSDPDLQHSSSPRHDLDLASFGVVATTQPIVQGEYLWRRKAAFDMIAQAFG